MQNLKYSKDISFDSPSLLIKTVLKNTIKILKITSETQICLHKLHFEGIC